MGEAKHTPGPWVVRKLAERMHGGYRPIFGNGLWGIYPADASQTRVPIAVIDHADDHHDETRAKAEDEARLIAAAPDLLEAIKATRALVSEGAEGGFTNHDWMERLFLNQRALTAAIAKAEGRS